MGEGFFVEDAVEVFVGGKTIKFTTGKIGRGASGSVICSQEDTMIMATACMDQATQEIDFTPLRVDYFERFSAAGLTSGGYSKRDGRPSDHEILISRFIDRPLRPMIADGWTHETQLACWVLSYDGVNKPDPLSICAASAAL